jgi:hypothetical protein
MAGEVRDGQISFFFDVQPAATVCNTPQQFDVQPGLCNRLQQFATLATLPNGSKSTKNV